MTAFNAYIQPFPNWYVLGPNIQYFAAHGVRGIFEEGSYGTSGGETQASLNASHLPRRGRPSLTVVPFFIAQVTWTLSKTMSWGACCGM